MRWMMDRKEQNGNILTGYAVGEGDFNDGPRAVHRNGRSVNETRNIQRKKLREKRRILREKLP